MLKIRTIHTYFNFICNFPAVIALSLCDRDTVQDIQNAIFIVFMNCFIVCDIKFQKVLLILLFRTDNMFGMGQVIEKKTTYLGFGE